MRKEIDWKARWGPHYGCFGTVLEDENCLWLTGNNLRSYDSFIYVGTPLWLGWVFAAVGCCLVGVLGLLTAVASLVPAPGLWSIGSAVGARGPCCSLACGIILDQGSNLRLLHWQADCFPLSHQRSPSSRI